MPDGKSSKMEEERNTEIPEIMEVPIDGILDLHTYHPSDVKDLLREYLEECRKRDILEVRIIHGKGRGVLRNIVESVLSEITFVKGFRPDLNTGNWGVTIAFLDSNK